MAGDLYVDTSCIDCGTCMWMAPDTFAEAHGMSAVHTQPEGRRERALQALVSCPTGSIKTERPADLTAAVQAFPVPITDTVSHCGYHARESFGAASYFVRGPAGNVLIDSPRFAGPLVRRLEAMGGVDWMLLTHRDDVADHARFAKHFGCKRVIHQDDDTIGAEVPLKGDRGTVAGLDWLHVPGHTKGSVVYRHGETVFTGDHLAGWLNPGAPPWGSKRRPGRFASGSLRAFRNACWYDWSTQIGSMERLAQWSFSCVLPGHGAPVRMPAEAMNDALLHCIAWMKRA